MESRNGRGFISGFANSSESRRSHTSAQQYSSESAKESKASMDSSESRRGNVSSESRGISYEDWLKTDPWIAIGGLSSASEMHQAYQEWVKEQKSLRANRVVTQSVSPEKKKYNSLDDIDKLIEKLEASMTTTAVTSEKANQILDQRRKKIEELKKLVAEARKAEAEDRMIKRLEQENSQLDDAIDSINKGFCR